MARETMQSPSGSESPDPNLLMNSVKRNKLKIKKSRKSTNKSGLAPTADDFEVPSSPPPPSTTKRKRDETSATSNKKEKKKHQETSQVIETGDNNDDSSKASQIDKNSDVATRKRISTPKIRDKLLGGASTPAASTPASEESPMAKSNGTRGPRIGRNGSLKIGFFTKEEVQLIEEFKVHFCNQYGLSTHKEFDSLVQHSERLSENPWPLSADVCPKQTFWEMIYEICPDRERRSVYRFMRRHFQDSYQKAHSWTKEQDDELIQLMTEKPGKWTAIAKQLGRSDDDVTQRWKNFLEHRDRMNHGRWSEKELIGLLDGVQRFFTLYKSENPESSCQDIYEMPVDGRSVAWGSVSDSMGNSRTRQQCADRWRKIQHKILEARAGGHPNAVCDPALEAYIQGRFSEGPGTAKSRFSVDIDENGNENDTRRDPHYQQHLLSSQPPDSQASKKNKEILAHSTDAAVEEPVPSQTDEAPTVERESEQEEEPADAISVNEKGSTPPTSEQSLPTKLDKGHKKQKKNQSKQTQDHVPQSTANTEQSSPMKSQDLDKKARKAARQEKRERKEKKRLEKERRAKEASNGGKENHHQGSLTHPFLEDTVPESSPFNNQALKQEGEISTPRSSKPKKHKKHKIKESRGDTEFNDSPNIKIDGEDVPF